MRKVSSGLISTRASRNNRRPSIICGSAGAREYGCGCRGGGREGMDDGGVELVAGADEGLGR